MDLPEIVAGLLASRGISSVEDAYRFLHPSLDHLHSPMEMLGMKLAVERLERAIAKLHHLPKGLQSQVAKRLLEYVEEAPTANEIVSIDQAREAYADGDFATLATWKLQMGFGDN